MGKSGWELNCLVVAGQELPLHPRPHRRLGKWAVGHHSRFLNRWLLQLNAAPMDERFPVPAFGRLAQRKRVCRELKLASGEQSLGVVPITSVRRVDGVGDRRRFDVYWFDLVQLEQLDMTMPGWRAGMVRRNSGGVFVLDSQEQLDLTDVWGTDGGLRRYRNILPSGGLLGSHDRDDIPLLAVRRVPNHANQPGDLNALIAPSSPLARRNHAVLRNAHDSRAPAVMVTLGVHPAIADGEVALDQPLRDGLGIELGEQVTAEPCRMTAKRPVDWVLRRLFGRRCFVYCRVQRADTNITGQGVATVDHLVLDLLGAAAGDLLTIDGIPERDGTEMPRVPSLRTKGYATPVETRTRREELSGGTSGRFPSAEEALGTYPDLPWVFLDRETRSALGLNYGSKHLGDLKLGVVRLGADRRYQVLKDFRETALLLALAGVPIIVISPSWLRWAGSAALVGLALANARWRLAQRLGRRE